MKKEYCEIFENAFPFWRELKEADKKKLCDNTMEVNYKKGSTIHDGNDCTGLIFVKSGVLRLYMVSEEGKEITLYRLNENDVCMLSASCVVKSITFDVIVDAEEDADCLIIKSGAFSDIYERYPGVKIFALESAAERFSDVMWVMQQILFMSFDKRLGIFLLDESARNGSDKVNLTQEQIAKYMGSAREVVSRMLKYFSAEGVVEVSRGGVKILDKKKLKEVCKIN